GQRVSQIRDVHVVLGVPLPRERQHRVWSGLDAALNPACEVDTEKRVTRVGYRINKIAHQELPFWTDKIIFASKRHDSHGAFLSCQLGDTICIESGACDQKIARGFAAGVDRAPSAQLTLESRHARAGDDFAAVLPD